MKVMHNLWVGTYAIIFYTITLGGIFGLIGVTIEHIEEIVTARRKEKEATKIREELYGK